VRNAEYSLFTFMKYEYVDPTNNLAGRELSGVVKHRVVKSLLRTIDGAEIFFILLAIMLTHKNSNILELLKKYLDRGMPPDDKPPADGHG